MVRSFLLVFVTLCALSAPVAAHAVLKGSAPADGEVVTDVKRVSLTFSVAVKLITLKLIGNKTEISLEVDRSAPAGVSFKSDVPAVPLGLYELKWTATGGDGHVMSGSIWFTLLGSS